MPANLENSAVATGLEKVTFIPIPKKGNAKECSNYHTIALISHASKVMLKIVQVKSALGSITMNKAGGGDGIPAELFQILKVDTVKVLHSIC